jgi:hypothetical protein
VIKSMTGFTAVTREDERSTMGVTIRTANVASGVGRHGENQVGGGINRLPVLDGGSVPLRDYPKALGSCTAKYRRDAPELDSSCRRVDLRLRFLPLSRIGSRFWENGTID